MEEVEERWRRREREWRKLRTRGRSSRKAKAVEPQVKTTLAVGPVSLKNTQQKSNKARTVERGQLFPSVEIEEEDSFSSSGHHVHARVDSNVCHCSVPLESLHNRAILGVPQAGSGITTKASAFEREGGGEEGEEGTA